MEDASLPNKPRDTEWARNGTSVGEAGDLKLFEDFFVHLWISFIMSVFAIIK